MPKIRFIIRPDGTITEEVVKAKGKNCFRLTQPLEKALGQVVKRQLSSDFYEETGPTVVQEVKQKGKFQHGGV